MIAAGKGLGELQCRRVAEGAAGDAEPLQPSAHNVLVDRGVEQAGEQPSGAELDPGAGGAGLALAQPPDEGVEWLGKQQQLAAEADEQLPRRSWTSSLVREHQAADRLSEEQRVKTSASTPCAVLPFQITR